MITAIRWFCPDGDTYAKLQVMDESQAPGLWIDVEYVTCDKGEEDECD